MLRLSLRKLYIEALTPSEFKPLMKIGRTIALQRINQIWSNLESQSTQKSRSGDRLYFDIQSGGSDEVQDPVKNQINQTLDQYGYELVDFAQGTAKKKGDKNIARLGKILTFIGKRDSDAIDLLNKYNNSKSTKVTGNQYVMVISKHPYDIGGMSTDRDWTSCMDLRSGAFQKYVPIDIERGTLVSYLINKTDMNIKKPVARVSIKPYIDTENEKDVLYGVERDEVKYGREHDGYIKTLISILDKAQQEKTGVFKFDGKIYQDYDNDRIVRISPEKLTAFKLKVKPMIKDLNGTLGGTYEELYIAASWLKNAKFENAEIYVSENDIIWEDGTWMDGTWEGGWWKNGIWEDGIWKDGNWKNGTWKNGIWEYGIWKDGTWKNGTWKDGRWANGIWENGEWKDGRWVRGIWKNGMWLGGTWYNGTWESGQWRGGNWLSNEKTPK